MEIVSHCTVGRDCNTSLHSWLPSSASFPPQYCVLSLDYQFAQAPRGLFYVKTNISLYIEIVLASGLHQRHLGFLKPPYLF